MKNLFLFILISAIFFFQTFSQVQPEWKKFQMSNSPLPGNIVYNISVDQNNNKWIATDNGILKIAGDDFNNFANWTIISGIPANYIKIIQADKDGNIWMANGAAVSGLIKYDGNTFTIYNNQNSPLPHNLISGITVDLSGNIWIMDGMEYLLEPIYLIRFDGINSWMQFPGNFGMGTIGDLAGVDSAGNLWTATEFKLSRMNTLTYTLTEWDTLYLGQYVTEVKPDFKGNIWIAGGGCGWGGLSKFDGQSFTYFDHYAYSLAVDNQKNLWIGTESLIYDTLKLLKFNGSNWIEYTPYNSPLPGAYRISNLEFDKHGNLWIAAGDSGIVVYKQGGIIIPVELASFTSGVIGNDVYLNWSTVTEKNNKGFIVEKKIINSQGWEFVLFVDGFGTTTELQNYSYTDKNIQSGKYIYRLTQVDFDGTKNILKEIEVEIYPPDKIFLEQNYPNPFNSSTTIRYSIPQGAEVIIKVYDVLGNEIVKLVSELKDPGIHEIKWSTADLPSGIYYYQLHADNYIQTRKMILLK